MIDLWMRIHSKLNIKESSQSALRVSVHDSENMGTFTQEAEQESKQKKPTTRMVDLMAMLNKYLSKARNANVEAKK